MLIKEPERGWDAATPLALDDEVGEASGQTGGDEQRNGGGLNHVRSLQIVELQRKGFLYSLCRDTDQRTLQTVGMIGPKYPNKLRAWREKREMTQEALAEAVGCSPASVGHWENGERRLTDKWLPALAKALKTQSGYLLEVDPEDVPADVLEVWSDIPEDRRAQALAVLQAFRTGTTG